MISYEEALSLIENHSHRLGAETLPLEDSLGRVASERVVCRENVPPFANSAMDGFAVRSNQTQTASEEAPVWLDVVSTIAAGDSPSELKEGACAQSIMTGAPLPHGADSVVMIEHVTEKEKRIGLKAPVSLGKHVRRAGEDFRVGDRVIREGERVTSAHVMALASQGVRSVSVIRRPKIAVIATGRELVDDGSALKPGEIRNSNTPYLLSEIKQRGCDGRSFGIVRDDPQKFHELMKNVLSWDPDIVLSTGAVSVGKFDFVAGALADLGAKKIFHRVKIRPGKPLLFARFESGVLFFGLPGNPVSTAVGFRFFVAPAISAMMGAKRASAKLLPLTNGSKKPEGLRCFFKGKRRDDGVEVLNGQESFKVSPLLESDCWVILDEGGDHVTAGDKVSVAPMEGGLWS